MITHFYADCQGSKSNFKFWFFISEPKMLLLLILPSSHVCITNLVLLIRSECFGSLLWVEKPVAKLKCGSHSTVDCWVSGSNWAWNFLKKKRCMYCISTDSSSNYAISIAELSTLYIISSSWRTFSTSSKLILYTYCRHLYMYRI